MNLRRVNRVLVALTCLFALCGQAAAAELAWETGPGFRSVRLAVAATGPGGFTRLAAPTAGLNFTNEIAYDRLLVRRVLVEGSGVAAGDFDGDGLPDLYFCHGDGANALFRNLGGFRFQEVTATAGVACFQQGSRGAAFADFSGDGRPDLLVTFRGGPNAYFLNEGEGRFRNLTAAAGLGLTNFGCTSLAIADANGDGTLDPYVVNTLVTEGLDGAMNVSYRTVNGVPRITGGAARIYQIVDGVLLKVGAPDAFYWNEGGQSFRAVSWLDGTFSPEAGGSYRQAPRGLGLAAAFRDFNGDGFPDLYVCSDLHTPDRIWTGDGRGKFRALPDLAIRTTSLDSMAVDFADLNHDGQDEIFVVDMLSRFHRLRLTQEGQTNPPASHSGYVGDRQQARRNTLQLSRGDGTYAEIANFAGVDASDWTWGAAFLDVDLDGEEDLLTVNGHAYDMQDLDVIKQELGLKGQMPGQASGKSFKAYPPLATPNFLFRNRGDLTFEEHGAAWGFNATNVSHGIALADLDGDGDLDVTVSCLGTPPLLYRNDASAPRVAVRLKGLPPNTAGIGARITVRGGAVAVQSQEIQAGGRYLSSDQPQRAFAAGSLTNRLSLEVRWRSGRRSVVADAEPNRLYEIDEAGAEAVPPSPPPTNPPPFFADISDRLGHTHEEAPFDDLERQPLLHRFLSRTGPGVAWFDLDANGRDELVIGGGRGSELAAFKTDGKGGFTRWTVPAFAAALPDDATGLAGWIPAPGQRALLAGISRYETEATNTPAVWQVNPASAPVAAVPPGTDLSAGPLAVADVDGDGDLDVFVGGRAVPGRYPEATASRLFRNEGGRLVADTANDTVLKSAGLVNGAVFSDLKGDGFPDLILATEWGPVRVFANTGGRLREATAELGLGELTGWWQGVTTGDFDGDGQLDVIAGNWGWNSTYYRPSAERPLRFYHGDFDDNGTWDLLESERDEVTGRDAPRRDLGLLSGGLPALRSRFPTYRQLSLANVSATLGEAAPRARTVSATTLATTVFLRRGKRFEAVPLPAEAQFAPVFAVNVADLDGDGHEDVFLSQNCSALRPEEPRLDAGRGLWLRGDGRGGFSAVPGQTSGILIYGEQRGAALADFDEDGRVDLVVAQNGGATKLYRNSGAQPGLTVRLQGPPGNPTAVGASLRLDFGGASGPLREIHAGSGYGSQDSAVQVLASPQPAKQLWVRWPNGRTTTTAVPAGAKAVTVTPEGTVDRR
jgi:hypothetical protein